MLSSIKKYLLFIIGLLVMAFGVALSVKADLGVSPISCIPYIFSLKHPFSFGETTIVFSILIILLQMIILRRQYQWFQMIQIPVAFVFGYFIDIAMYTLTSLFITEYVEQLFLCMLSCIVLALGIFILIKAKVSYLPGEGLITAIVEVLKKDFGLVKITVDTAMVAIVILSSIILLEGLIGIREGTIMAAFLVGYLLKFYQRIWCVIHKQDLS